MNGRRLYREYLKSKGCDCKSFIKLEEDYYTAQTITYKDSDGKIHTKNICVKDMMRWVIKNLSNSAFENFN